MNYSIVRAIKFAFQDFWRNIWLSLVTITVLVLAILSVNILVSLSAISNKIVESVKDKVDISIFFKSEIDQAQIDNFQIKLKNIPEVKEVILITKEKALEEFKQKHKDEPKILEALKEVEKNPLADALVIRARDTEDYNKILGVLSLKENQDLIKFQNFTDHKKIIDQINLISSKIEKISLAITLIFVLISILIVFNAIRVTIYTHKDEISVMRLVGASDRFIRAPFIIESVIYSVFSIGIAIVLLYAIFGAIGPYLADFLQTYNFDLIEYYNQNFFMIFGAEFAVVLLLNAISCSIAVRRYLRG
ncbi:ABC transporter permease [Patescibacteria group bacterium]|nr:ABC transporter permease [Patescibacteria group bacterium]